MEESILSLVAVFLFGLVFLKKEPPLSKEKNYSSVRNRKSSDVSGVDKYLQDKQGELLQDEVSGVAKYLAGKELGSPVSGVEKYLAQQTVQTNNNVKENASGVEKYLNNRG